MTFSNYINTSEDDEFLRQLPIPNEDDSEWVTKLAESKDSGKHCNDCKYYDNNPILPCAVNPEKLHNASNCPDYSEK